MKTFATLLASAAVALGLSIGGVARASDSHHGGGHHGGEHHDGGHHDGGHHSFHDYGHYSGHYGHLGLGLLGYTAYRSYSTPYYSYGYSRPYYGGRVASGSASRSLGGEVQIELARLGYYRGPIDGIIGSGTRRALRYFQAEAGLPVTGRIDRATIEELGIG